MSLLLPDTDKQVHNTILHSSFHQGINMSLTEIEHTRNSIAEIDSG